MREIEQSKKTGKGRKALVVVGIIFLIAGIFLASFACSFQVMIQSAASEPAEGTLEAENEKLREENQLLQDRITILESEIEASKPTAAMMEATSTPTASSSATAKPTQSAKPTATATKSSATKTPAPSATKTAKPTASSNSTLVE